MIYSQQTLLDHSTHSANDSSSVHGGKSSDDSSAAAAILKRPLSGYNIFFQLQRKRIIDGTSDMNRFITLEEAKVYVESQRVMRNLPQPKRPHRKTHGKIGFREMARLLAEQWKSLTPQQKHVYDTCAAAEKVRYLEEKKLMALNLECTNNVLLNENVAVTDDIPAVIIQDDNSRDGYGSISVPVARIVPQIVRMPITREISREEQSDDVDDNLLHDGSNGGDMSDDLYESQREILYNTRMIQYQKAKLQRLQQQMEMFAMNQRRMQLMEIMKQQQQNQHQQKRLSMQMSSYPTNNNWMELMKQQQQQEQRRASLYNTSLFPNNVSPMNDISMNFSPQVQAAENSFQNDFGGDNSSEEYINEVHDLADRTFEGVTDFLSMNNYDDDFTPLNSFNNEVSNQNDFIVQEFNQFQEEENNNHYSGDDDVCNQQVLCGDVDLSWGVI